MLNKLSFCFAFLLLGCSLFDSPPVPGTLYYRINGATGTQEIVDQFVVEILLDPTLNTSFINLTSDKLQLASFKQALTDFLCAKASGGCAYPSSSTLSGFKRITLGSQLHQRMLDKFVYVLHQKELLGLDREYLELEMLPWISTLILKEK